MKIAHLCLSCFYIDGFSYQENLLPRFHKRAGHDVIIIASTETYLSNGKIGYTKPGHYINEDGIPVVRVAYSRLLPFVVMKKVRKHPGIFQLLEAFAPDIIIFHGLCGWEIITAARYKSRHPSVRLYADSHEDANNSARTFLSRYLLHKLYYRNVLRCAIQSIDRVLYVSLETRNFIHKMYSVPENKMSFFPLGGVVLPDDEYSRRRKLIREQLSITSGDILILQAGKFEKRKKVLESMEAFATFPHKKLKLILVGSVDNDIHDRFFYNLAQDNRIIYVGWKNSDDLMSYLCAADVYLQPGSQSALMQNAICQRCPVILDDVPSHKPYLVNNGWLLNDSISLVRVFREIVKCPERLQTMSSNSLALARSLLDYERLSQKIVEGDF